MKVENGRVRFETRADLAPGAGSSGTTAWNRTGTWKYLEPSFEDGTPPCTDRCPTDVDVVAMMRSVEAGRWEEAVRGVIAVNPFPSVTGRVCPRPCMQPCNRKALGGGVDVAAVEREVGDWKLRHGVKPPLPEATFPEVDVFGAGPAGLSAAVALRRLGHPVVVHGRVMAEFPDAEVRWVESLGVRFGDGDPGPTVLVTHDAAPDGGRSVVEGIRAGRAAAEALHGEIAPPPRRDARVVKFKDLNPAWFDREPPSPGPDGEERARAEAARCFKCGTCTGCDTCLVLCPDFAIRRGEGDRVQVDLEHCKGCGVCAEECPRGAILFRRAP